MPLYDVLNEVAGQLDGLTVPGVPTTDLKAVKAAVAFPVGAGVADPQVPLLFIWPAGDERERRKTMPRNHNGQTSTAGTKRLMYEVAAFLVVNLTDAGARNCQVYLELLEAVANELRLLGIPISLTNPDSGQASTIVMIGDNINVRSSVPRSVKNQKIVQFRGAVTTEVWEDIQA